MNLRFDDLALHQAAFEIRYGNAFLLWDRSGSVWAELLSAQPDLKATHAEPSKIVFARRGDRELQLTVEIRRLVVVAVQPDARLSEFSDIVTRFAEIAVRNLQISVCSRVGLRVSFIKEYADREAAAEALLQTGMLRLPPDPVFGLSTPVVEPEISIRREDSKNGFSLRLKAETITFELDPSFGLAKFIKPESVLKHRIHLDVDSYLQAPIETSKLYFSDWINQTFHVIKRDSRKFFGD